MIVDIILAVAIIALVAGNMRNYRTMSSYIKLAHNRIDVLQKSK